MVLEVYYLNRHSPIKYHLEQKNDIELTKEAVYEFLDSISTMSTLFFNDAFGKGHFIRMEQVQFIDAHIVETFV